MDWSASLQGLVGGVLIGLSAVWLMATLGRIAGISGIVGSLVTTLPKGDSAWRVAFVLGLISGPLLLMLTGGGLGNVAGEPGEVVGQPAGGVGLMLVAGLLVGVGTGLGSGCTSGHGVCGLARLSPRSMVATATFLACAIVTVYVVRHVIGGGA
ncbi:YeeE/YedE family protein [Halomonas sp. MCCC 1A17488]|uniref:YeeE/YedE family protein n=1 Tax=Billgrantia sulfidoxydans TaxID=2733484 RepID=A0ABX7W825_9GAMM|nr:MULTISPECIES: YeeE/YedE family protein [Halomonas]MCE8018118.1 YeeE/YedE family protein [Halomonas sp. MCCC 1A17488]MCG3241451.1 YeeE/YedE family protein [Halomonas sp. MCCC 1A17488]QPP48590.1 YeeE/YedE family protein [Halomonas sp. SS10-MC5]QTP55935.1 YeeE/YedE family protein [Halomonas sulfidoxydans]